MVLIAALAVLSACATSSPTVEYMDELTAVTITHSRTPFVLSTETPFDTARDYVQIGTIEVNRMGTLKYYLWLGISEVQYDEPAHKHPEGFKSIVFVEGDGEFQLELAGWTEAAIGASAPIYEKLFRDTVNAYYEISTEQIRQLASADIIRFRTVDPAPKEYSSLYRSVAAKDDLTEFLTIVAQ